MSQDGVTRNAGWDERGAKSRKTGWQKVSLVAREWGMGRRGGGKGARISG